MCDLPDVNDRPRMPSRRAWLKRAAAAAATASLLARAAHAGEPRTLALYHTHTGQRLSVTYAADGRLIPAALEEINAFLGDFRSGRVHPIDPQLLDALHALHQRAGGRGRFEIISAYRSPETNEMLRRTGGGGVAQRSLHMEGRAIDVRLTGVATSRLREEALALGVGGVGYYPDENFVHVDTGRVRQW